jgi:hypothetical protein
MSCTAARYASAADFVGFWCTATVLTGAHTALAGTTLTDANATFVSNVVRKGHYIRNITQDIKASITNVVSETQLETLPAITWATNDIYEIIEASYANVVMLEGVLDKAVSPIQVSLLTAGMCDCTLEPASLSYLATLNIVSAAILPACLNCGLMRPDWPASADRKNWMDWLNQELSQIRKGEIELCQGETGKDFPALAWAEVNYNKFSEAEIWYNVVRRSLR